MHRLSLFAPAALIFVLQASALAARPAPPVHEEAPVTAGTFSVYMENDLFGGTDRYYTSGVKIGWSSADLEKFSDTPYASPLLPLINLLTFIPEGTQKNLVFAFGQNIYTPDDTESEEVVEGDRPYAGWLYAGFGLVWKHAAVRHSLVLNLGVVGSYSYGEEAQRLVHEARGLGMPRGWDNQLHNEIGVLATYQVTGRWPHQPERKGFDWEVLPHAGLALGNVEVSARAGAEWRAGINLPDDFGTATIAPGDTTPTPVEGTQQAARVRKFDIGAYVFARAEGRVVAHNIFLNGNTFGDSHSVDQRWVVADLSVGTAFNYKNTKFTYALVYRTKEFEGQEEGQVFGSISVNFAF